MHKAVRHFLLGATGFLIATSAALLPVSAQKSGQELFSNPSFSSNDDWFFRDATIQDLDGSAKSKQVLLNGAARGKDQWTHVGTEIRPVPVDHELLFSCRFRGTQAHQNLMVNAFAYDASEKLLKSWSSQFPTKGTEWLPVSTKYIVPANAANLTLWMINTSQKPAYVTQPSMRLGAFSKSETVAVKSAKTDAAKSDDKDDEKYDEHIPGWFYYANDKLYETGIDKDVHHTGSASAYIKSLKPAPSGEFGNVMQALVPNNYLDQRVKLTGWVKTRLASGSAQMWIRVDGDWKDDQTKPGTFDNMDDRPIKGDTDWHEYSLVVDIPPNANHVTFGLMHLGTGTIWLDDVSFTRVSKDVPLTGNYATLKGCGKKEAFNMGFEDPVTKP